MVQWRQVENEERAGTEGVEFAAGFDEGGGKGGGGGGDVFPANILALPGQ